MSTQKNNGRRRNGRIPISPQLNSIELCAGGGGQALGLELAGFRHLALIDNDKHCINTLIENRPFWNAQLCDISDFPAKDYRDIDLLAAGLPCPPFSVAGKQLGKNDERDLFPYALNIIGVIRPRAIMIENVAGLLDERFSGYRQQIEKRLNKLGYETEWFLLNARDFGVSQFRARLVIVALKKGLFDLYVPPQTSGKNPKPVGKLLFDLISERNWKKAEEWASGADGIAPTLVGGSKKHGGPDLGPVRARKAWEKLGVDGMGIADLAPDPDFRGMPRLTLRMTARLQGFPDEWVFSGGKTASYRQIGNALPPPVSRAVGMSIACALSLSYSRVVGAAV